MLPVEMTSRDFVGVFVDAEGRIVTYLRCSRGHEKFQSRPDCRLVEGDYSADEVWFNGGVPTPRPRALSQTEITVRADGQDEHVRLPAHTEVWRDGAPIGAVADGMFTFSTTVPGEYRFDLKPPFPYIEQTLKVTAHAP